MCDWYVTPPRSFWQGCTRVCGNREAMAHVFSPLLIWAATRIALAYHFQKL